MSLKENLDALTASLPDVPAELEALKGRAEGLERAVVDFLNEIGERDAHAGTQLHELRQALAALGHEGEGERTQLESQMDAFEERLEAGLGELREDEDRLTQALEAAGTAMVSLRDVLEDTATSAKTAEQEAVKELGDLEEAAGAAEEAVRAAFGMTEAEADALRAIVEESCASVTQAMDGLLQRMRVVAGEARQRIDQTAERLDGLSAAHEAEIPEQRSLLVETQQAIIKDMRERVESELRARIAETTEVVLAALAEMRAEALEAAAACAGGHETLEAGFETLREATRPMPQAIGAVKGAAVQLAVPWA
jgi:hypothetical protein